VNGTGSIDISNSKFSGFRASTALVLWVTGYIKLYEVDFKDFQCQSGSEPFAVKVGQAQEFQAERSRFSDFTDVGLIFSADWVETVGGGYRYLFNLYNVEATNIVGVPYRALIHAEFDTFYSENLVVTNARAQSLVQVSWSGHQGIPVLRHSKLTDVTATAGLFRGLSGSYFALNGGTLQNSEDDAWDQGTTFYENVSFLATGNYAGYAIRPNGGFSVVSSTVRGFKVGIRASETNAKFLICGTIFTDCQLAIEAHQQEAEILECSFTGYKEHAIVSMNGQYNGLVVTFVVRKCVFGGGSGGDISFSQRIRIVDCCSRSVQNITVSVGGISATYEGRNCGKGVAESQESCPTDCGGFEVVNVLACEGELFTARPTWAVTRTPVAPRVAATASPAPTPAQSPALTPVASPALTPVASPTLTPFASPLQTAIRSPVVTLSAVESATISLAPAATRSRSFNWLVPVEPGTPEVVFPSVREIGSVVRHVVAALVVLVLVVVVLKRRRNQCSIGSGLFHDGTYQEGGGEHLVHESGSSGHHPADVGDSLTR
jgi:hypothetical protein